MENDYSTKIKEEIQKKMDVYTNFAFNPTNYFLKIGKSYES